MKGCGRELEGNVKPDTEQKKCNWIRRHGKDYQVSAIGIFCIGREHTPIPIDDSWLKRCRYKREDIPSWIEFVHELQNWHYWSFKKVELKID